MVLATAIITTGQILIMDIGAIILTAIIITHGILVTGTIEANKFQ